MAKLELFLLGTPQIYVDGQAITGFNARKDLALLTYLAATGTTHSRETLAGLLWSDLPEANARRNLRHALSHLQKVIGPQWLTTARGIALSQDQPWSLDLQTLRTVVKNMTAYRTVDSGHTDPQALATLTQVLTLYRGEFLQDFHLHEAAHFEEWVLAQREEARRLALHGLETLVECCLVQGAYDQGLAATQRLLHLEPWSEPAHCLQMQLLARSGRRSTALAQYKLCCQILATELGVEPLPTTIILHEQIRAGQYDPAPLTPTASKVGWAQTIPHNLVTPLAGFVGRQAELAFIRQRLGTADCRLLTIIGPGGMGKTSLAHAAAQQILHTKPTDFPDGIYFVSLLDIDTATELQPEQTPVDDPTTNEAILRAIADAIGYKLEPSAAPALQLQRYLHTRRLLLILDNFEHLLVGTTAIVMLLTHAPQIKALITSRTRLNLRGESVLTLENLSLPPVAQANPALASQPEAWQASEALAMFIQRAQQVDPTFLINAETMAPIAQICQLVGGLPLGIELATSMLPLLNCRMLADALTNSLDVLTAETRDLPRAQRNLGAVFDRSWRLLPPEGQQLLANLAIFPGSFGYDAAIAIAGATSALLRRLLDQSLLSKVGDDRYAMHRTVHVFAQQKLQQWPEQHVTLCGRYAHFYLEGLARLEEEQGEAAYTTAMAQLQSDLENVRTAWRWSVEQGDLALLALSAGSLHDFYATAGIYAEALQLLDAALITVRHAVAHTPDADHADHLLARLLCYTARFYRLYQPAGALEKGEQAAQEALERGRRLADPALQGLACHELARLAQARNDFVAMHPFAEQACTYARLTNLPHLAAECLNDLGIARTMTRHPLAGIPYFHEARDCLRQRPNRALDVRIVNNLGLFYLAGHEYQEAYRYLQQRMAQPLLQDWIHFGDLLVKLGVYTAAQAEYERGFALLQARQEPQWECWLHLSYGRLQRLRGDPVSAHTACRRALQLAQKEAIHFVAQWAQINLGHIFAELGDRTAAAYAYQEAIMLYKGRGWFSCPTDAHAGLAALAFAQHEVPTALAHVDIALSFLAQHGLAATTEPFAAYWTCVRVLQAVGDPRAQSVLATAYQKLQQIAQQLEAEHLRHAFLENVLANRNLVAAAQAIENRPDLGCNYTARQHIK